MALALVMVGATAGVKFAVTDAACAGMVKLVVAELALLNEPAEAVHPEKM